VKTGHHINKTIKLEKSLEKYLSRLEKFLLQ